MRLLPRGVFAALALLVLAAQIMAIRADMVTPEAPNLGAGLVGLGLRPAPSPAPDLLAATAPGCAEPLLLTLVDFNGVGQAAGQGLLDRPGVPRVVYLGFVGTHAGTATIMGRWAVASLLRLLGLRAEPAPQRVVLVMLPTACPDLRELDWSRLSPWS